MRERSGCSRDISSGGFWPRSCTFSPFVQVISMEENPVDGVYSTGELIVDRSS